MKKIVYAYLYRILAVVFMLLGTRATLAQELGMWQVYPSYGRATQCVVVDNYVYAIFEGALVRYNVSDSSVRTYDCINDLNDINVLQIGYSADAKRLIVVYENGNIDLIDVLADRSFGKRAVFNISALKDKTLSDKTISSLYIKGVVAYIATGFGFVAVDMLEGVIVDTYQLGLNVRSVAITDEDCVILATNGLYHARTTDNLQLSSSWELINPATTFQNAVQYEEKLYLRTPDALYRMSGTNLTTVLTFTSPSVQLRVLHDGSMACVDKAALYLFTSASNYEKIPLGGTVVNDIDKCGKVYFTCEADLGLKGYTIDENALKNVIGTIRPNSPHRNRFYKMNYVPNGEGDYRLLVVGGENTFQDEQFEPLAMYYDNGRWTLLDDSPARTILPGVVQFNSTDIVQDPLDSEHIFVGTWRNGLKEYRNDKMIEIYNSDNSLIRSILPDSRHYHQYESATSTIYDTDGNLWFAQQETDTLFRYISPDKKWHSVFIQEMAKCRRISSILFTSSNVIFTPCRLSSGIYDTGLFAFMYNGRKVTTHRLVKELHNQDGISYGPLDCNAIIEDLTGTIWLGTTAGLFVIEEPSQFFSSDFAFTQIKINRNDGSGLADYLLNGVAIRSLAVDGGNRKWVGTQSNGVYLISADGQELLQHFNTSNSPLISNCVKSIAIHPKTGEVMFGTDRGLCSYMGDATEPAEKLSGSDVVAYPNPVTPDHVGPIRIDGLTFGAEVKILSSAGQLVASGTSNGGTFVWDGRNRQGRRVSSGIYHVVSSTESGKKAVVTRIAVVR